jgi:hypothetical protein
MYSFEKILFIAIEEMNDSIKKQICMNNNHFNTVENCLKYFSRNHLLTDFRRTKRTYTKWTQESKENKSQKVKEKIDNKNNYIIKPQFKKCK